MSLRRNRALRPVRLALLAAAALLLTSIPFSAQSLPSAQIFPGGFLEKATSGEVRPRLTASQIQSFLPARGLFSFPLPYGTQGIRLTNASDCGGADCVNYVGYSYWRNINNHAGSDTMYVFLGLSKARGGGGPTLFAYDKVTEAVANLGPLFAPADRFSDYSGEGWYFSATMPTALYVNDGSRLLRYDVLSHAFTTVFDASTRFGTGYWVWQAHSSNDDRTHSATLRSTATSEMLGCMAYRSDTGQFYWYPRRGAFDECQVDKSGRWLVIKENVDGLYGEDNRIIDLDAGQETVLLDQNGAAGHSDLGYGYMVAADDWNNLPSAVRLWKFGQTLAGPVVYYMTDWSSDMGHVTHANAKPGVAPEQQYVCSSNASRYDDPRANEIVCYRLDTSLDVLVVAPVMTDLNASGGGDDYSKVPKGNLDPTGQYFIWTSNLGGGRLDAFIVKVPSHLLTGGGGDVTSPTVAVTAPLPGATVTGAVTVAAAASDDVGVAGVQFTLDGAALGAERTAAPYTLFWDTTTTTNGAHAIAAVARDAAGNSATSAPVSLTVSNVTAAPAISSVASSSITQTGATITWLTDLLSDSQVEYGTSSSYGASTPVAGSLVLSHSVSVSSLTAGTTYHYRVKSKTLAGVLSVSPDNVFTTPAAPPAVTGGIGWWKFDEAAGATAYDSSGGGYDGAMKGPIRIPGAVGGALSFDGVNDYVNVAHRAALNAYPITLSAWIRINGAASGAVVSKYYAGSFNGYQIYASSGSLCARYFRSSTSYVYDGSGCTMATPGYADGRWHHVALVVDSAGGRLFVDGAQKASRAWTGAPGPPTTGRNLLFGRYAGSPQGYLRGDLDEVRVHDRALSPAEVAQLYGLASSGDVTPPAISSVAVATPSSSGAVVTWTTDEPSDTQVEYGTTALYGTSTPPDPSFVTSHSGALAGLSAGTLYHYRVRSRDAAGNVATTADATFTTPAAGIGPQDVAWTQVVNCTVTGATLQKTGGVTGLADAGAVSQQWIASGDGWFEFTSQDNATLRYAGLSSGSAGTDPSEIQFALRLQSGIAEVRERGVYKWDTTFAPGDVLRVAVASGVVSYYKNGARFYTSAAAPTYPMLVDTSLVEVGGTIEGARIAASP